MPLIIPTSTEDPEYTQRTALDGRDFILRFTWNAREFRWYFSISDADGVSIAAGLKVVAGWPLLRKVQDPRVPPGVLWAVPMIGDDDPRFLELAPAQRVRFIYLTAAEVAEGA